MNIKNKIQIIGTLTEVPQIIHAKGHIQMAVLKIVTTEIFYNVEYERVTEKMFHRVIVYGQHAQIADRYLSVESEIAIEGKLIYIPEMDCKSTKCFRTEIHASELLVLTSNRIAK